MQDAEIRILDEVTGGNIGGYTILTYKNITIVTEKGIDCDENYTV
jgi:hypothetical protein